MAPQRVNRETLVDAAMRIVEQDGIEQLSMRKLAAELGVAITSIYWHVGNREALLDALVEREIADVGALTARGRSPEERIASLARSLRRKLLARPHVIGLVHERGLTPLMFVPAQSSLAREFRAAGLGPERTALAVKSIQSHVIASVVLERWESRSPSPTPELEARLAGLFTEAGVEPGVASKLAAPLRAGELFERSTEALVTTWLESR